MSASYVTGVVTSNDALYTTIRTQILAAGWTTYDTISDTSGNREQVFRSAIVDSGAQAYCYMRLYMVGTNFGHSCYDDWDTTANVGQHEAFYANYSADLTGQTYHLRVNEWALGLVMVSGSTYRKMYSGLLRRGLRKEKAGRTRITVAATAGNSSVTVNDDLTTSLRPGQSVLIYNHGGNSGSANWGNVEQKIVQSVTSTTISFTTNLGNSYDIGAVIGENPLPYTVLNLAQTSSATSAQYTCYTGPTLTGSWTGTQAQLGQTNYVFTTYEPYTDPQESDGFFGGGAWICSQTSPSAFYGSFYHYEVCSQQSAYTFTLGDIMDDTVDQLIVIVHGWSSAVLLFGPI